MTERKFLNKQSIKKKLDYHRNT